jgi:hypothetical protein
MLLLLLLQDLPVLPLLPPVKLPRSGNSLALGQLWLLLLLLAPLQMLPAMISPLLLPAAWPAANRSPELPGVSLPSLPLLPVL